MTIYWKDKKRSLCPSHLICSDREVGNICVEKPAETGGGHFVESIEINTKSCDVREHKYVILLKLPHPKIHCKLGLQCGNRRSPI